MTQTVKPHKPPHPHSWLKKLIPVVGLLVFTAAAWIIYHEIHSYHWWQIKAAISGIPASVIGLSLLCSFLGYFALANFDWLAIRYTQKYLPYHKIIFTAGLAYAFSNNIGYAPISGGALRYRFYSNWHLSFLVIAKVIVFCLLTYILGFASIFAVVAFSPINSSLINISPITFSVIQYACLLGIAIWWLLILFYRKDIHLKGMSFKLPTIRIGLGQIALGVLDLTLASLVLYIPLYHYVAIDFPTFLLIFLLAQILGLISQVPGGIGVFEGGFLYLTANHIDSSHVLAALIFFRCIYFFVPLILGAITLMGFELVMVFKRRRYKKNFPVQ